MRRLAIVLVALIAVGAVLPAAAVGADAEARADLVVNQPSYIEESVEVVQANGTVVYQVRGPEHDIRLQNDDHENVTAFGIEEGAGSLTWNEAAESYHFDAEGREGSTTLYWDVEETVTAQEENETVVQTQTTRYTAVIQVSAVNWAHRPAEEDDELQAAADKWEAVKEQANKLAPNEDVEDVLSSAFTYFRFFDSPFATLVMDMRGTLTMMLLRPGGWVITGVFVGVSLLGLVYGARYRNRTQKQFAELDDIQVERDRAFVEKLRRWFLQQEDWNQFLPDDTARAMRDLFGDNLWVGFKQYTMLRSPTHVKGVVLQLMAQVGYEGRVKHGDEELLDARLVRDSDAATDGGDYETVDLAELQPDDEGDREFIEAVPGDQLDPDVFREDIDFSAVSFGIGHRDIDDGDLLEELDPNFPEDFEDEEHLADVLREMIEFVGKHDHTDDLGRSHRELDILSFLAQMDTVMAERADFHVGHFHRKLLAKAAEEMDPGEDLQDTVDRVNEEGAGV